MYIYIIDGIMNLDYINAYLVGEIHVPDMSQRNAYFLWFLYIQLPFRLTLNKNSQPILSAISQ